MSARLRMRLVLPLVWLALAGGCERAAAPGAGPATKAAQPSTAGSGPGSAGADVRAACPQGRVCLSPNEAKQAGIELLRVEPSQNTSTIEAMGRLTFDDLQVAHVVSPLSGRLAHVAVALGDRVERGQALATLHAPQMGSMLADAAAAVADEVAAERDYQRQKGLFAEHALATKDFEAAQNRRAQARALATLAREKQALLGAHGPGTTDTYVLRAPIDGNVVARNVAVGTEVVGSADAGSDAPVLFTIGSLASVWAVGEVYTPDASSIAPRAAATVQVTAFPQLALSTTVDWVANNVDKDSGTVRVRCQLPNPQGLFKPDMTASLHIASTPVVGLWVPEPAVFHLGGRPYVFVAEQQPDGALHCRQQAVVIGKVSAAFDWLLTEGLRPNDLVVRSHGIFLTGAFSADAAEVGHTGP